MVSIFNQNKDYFISSNYKLYANKRLGSGAFGEVFKGINIDTQEEVAIKMVYKKKNIFNYLLFN